MGPMLQRACPNSSRAANECHAAPLRGRRHRALGGLRRAEGLPPESSGPGAIRTSQENASPRLGQEAIEAVSGDNRAAPQFEEDRCKQALRRERPALRVGTQLVGIAAFTIGLGALLIGLTPSLKAEIRGISEELEARRSERQAESAAWHRGFRAERPPGASP